MEAQLAEKQNRLAEVSGRLGAMMNNFRKYQVKRTDGYRFGCVCLRDLFLLVTESCWHLSF